jgi:hypothetical protein
MWKNGLKPVARSDEFHAELFGALGQLSRHALDSARVPLALGELV